MNAAAMGIALLAVAAVIVLGALTGRGTWAFFEWLERRRAAKTGALALPKAMFYPHPRPPPDIRLLVDSKLSDGRVGVRFVEGGLPLCLSAFDIAPLTARRTAYRLLTAADAIDHKSSKLVVDGVEQHFTLETK